MKDLAALGIGALVCLPCLAVIAGVSLAAVGGALTTFAANPVVQATGVLVTIAGLATAGHNVRRRRACPQCESERSQGRPPAAIRHGMHK